MTKIREQLIAMSSEKLADILLECAATHKDIKKKLTVVVAGQTSDPKKLLSIINRELSTLEKAKGMIFYEDIKKFAQRLDALRANIVQELAPKSINHAVEAMSVFLDLANPTIGRTDDSYGYISDIFVKACQDWGELYGKSPYQVEACVQEVYDRFLNDKQGVFDNVIFDFKGVLGEEGLTLLQRKFLDNNPKKDREKYKQKEALMNVADCKKDVDAYIAAASANSNLDFKDRIDVIQRLLEQWRTDEAIKWIQEAEDIARKQSLDLYWTKDLFLSKIQALELSGHYAEAQRERVQLFRLTLDLNVYEDALKHLAKEAQQEFRALATQIVFDFPDATMALQFFSAIHDGESISLLIRQRLDDLNGKAYSVLRDAAKKMAQPDPLGAVLLYRKLLEATMATAQAKYYPYAVKDLSSIETLNRVVKDWEGYQHPIAYNKDFETKHKKKHSFWDLYKAKR